jgi:hypothetical protein
MYVALKKRKCIEGPYSADLPYFTNLEGSFKNISL